VGIATALAHAPDQPGPAIVGCSWTLRCAGAAAGSRARRPTGLPEGGQHEHPGDPRLRTLRLHPTGDSRPLAHTPSLSEIRMLRDLACPVTSLRAGTAADARRIAELQVRAWQAAYRGVLPTRISLDCRSTSASASGRHWNDGQRCAGSGSSSVTARLVGFAATGPSRDEDGALHARRRLAPWPGVHARHAVDDRGNARAHRFYEAASWRATAGARWIAGVTSSQSRSATRGRSADGLQEFPQPVLA